MKKGKCFYLFKVSLYNSVSYFKFYIVMLLQPQEITQEKVLLPTLTETSTTVTLSLDAEKAHPVPTPTINMFTPTAKQKILTKEPGKTI